MMKEFNIINRKLTEPDEVMREELLKQIEILMIRVESEKDSIDDTVACQNFCENFSDSDPFRSGIKCFTMCKIYLYTTLNELLRK